jgi:hypothetical protein
MTFNEKVRYKMLRDHRPLVVTFADKVAVRDYVEAILGNGYLPRLHAVLSDPQPLRSLELPLAYVLKPSHGSGAVIIVSDSAPSEARLPDLTASWAYRHVQPTAADRDLLVTISAHWLEQLYGQGPNREWAYGKVPRKLLVEEMLIGQDGCIPADYKLFVFHGQCRFIQVDSGRFAHRTQDFYTSTWERLTLSGGVPPADTPPSRPANLDEMIHIAERLGHETDFVRVDLYSLEDRVVFGELTNYPAGGDSPFFPESFNAEFGRTWTVPRRYH